MCHGTQGSASVRLFCEDYGRALPAPTTVTDRRHSFGNGPTSFVVARVAAPCYPSRLAAIPTMACSRKNYLHSFLCVVATTVAAAGSSADGSLRYFRFDKGVAGPAAGPLPDRFDAPGALGWRVPLDSGRSTPVLCSGKIFLTTYRSESKELATVALDDKTGQMLWRRSVAAARIEQTHPIGSPATATPSCDG